jgi:hypothetical protein
VSGAVERHGRVGRKQNLACVPYWNLLDDDRCPKLVCNLELLQRKSLLERLRDGNGMREMWKRSSGLKTHAHQITSKISYAGNEWPHIRQIVVHDIQAYAGNRHLCCFDPRSEHFHIQNGAALCIHRKMLQRNSIRIHLKRPNSCHPNSVLELSSEGGGVVRCGPQPAVSLISCDATKGKHYETRVNNAPYVS